MRLLLVNPKVPPSVWSLSDVEPITGTHGMMPPLALTTVAALTPTDADVEIALVDEAEGLVDLDTECDVVGITGYVTQRDRIIELAEAFRARGRLVLLGGPHVSLAPDTYRPYGDVLFVGEAELTWPQFVADHAAGSWQDTYVGDRIDITRSPVPRHDLVDFGRFHMGSVQTSRGCPFECEFCDVIIYLDRRQRHKTPAQVVTELEVLYQQGYRDVFLCDDNLTAHRGRSARILDAVIEWNDAKPEPVRFVTQVSIDVARDQDTPLLERAARAGLRLAFVGLETSDPEALHEAKKHQNVRVDLVGDIHKVQRQGIQVQSGLVCGFDADDLSSFRHQYEFMQAAGTPNVAVTMLSAPEGTPLETRLEAAGRILPTVAGDGHVALAAGLFTNVVPLQMTQDQLRTGVVWLLNQLYRPEAFLERVAVLADCLPDGELADGDVRAFPGELLDTWRRMRFAFRDLGPAYAKLPHQAAKLLHGKEPVHLATAIIWYFNVVHLLDGWGVLDPESPYPEADEVPVQVGRPA
jgi:radical SAM superfamily enzyme YgiQ (UPF0313 family)